MTEFRISGLERTVKEKVLASCSHTHTQQHDERLADTTLHLQERDLHHQKAQYAKLKDDFQYNLKVHACILCHQSEAHAIPESLPTHSVPTPQLIEDRDNELDRYDTAFTQLQTTIRERYVEGSAHVCRVVYTQSYVLLSASSAAQ